MRSAAGHAAVCYGVNVKRASVVLVQATAGMMLAVAASRLAPTWATSIAWPAAAAVLAWLVAKPWHATRRMGVLLVASLLVALSGWQAQIGMAGATMDETVVDLTAASPQPHALYGSVRGYLRAGFAMDEYDVPEGGRPDQSKDPAAVLLAMAGTAEGPIAVRDRLIFARVPKGTQPSSHVVQLRGRFSDAPAQIVATLTSEPQAAVHAQILDTLAAPPQPGVTLALAAIFAALAAAGFFFAASTLKIGGGEHCSPPPRTTASA